MDVYDYRFTTSVALFVFFYLLTLADPLVWLIGEVFRFFDWDLFDEFDTSRGTGDMVALSLLFGSATAALFAPVLLSLAVLLLVWRISMWLLSLIDKIKFAKF